MNPPKVTVGVIVFKETKYLDYSLTSLLDQDYPNIQFIIRDHSPQGEVYEWLEQRHPNFFKKAKITVEDNAAMHSGGQNAMIREGFKNGSDYYFCVSNDMLYPKNFVTRIVEEMQEKKMHVATCKLMRWDFERAQRGDLEGSKTSFIDSLGIGLTKGHKFFDIGQGQKEDEFHSPPPVLGPSGALAVFDKEALEAIAYKNNQLEYFDENLYYKNDCDLSYRLSWADFPCLVADVKVYHDRQLGEKGTGALNKFKEHHQKAAWAKESSLFGHLVTLQKNFDTNYSFFIKFKTKISNVARYLYTFLFTPKMLTTYKKARALKNEIKERREQMKKVRSAKDMEKLMV